MDAIIDGLQDEKLCWRVTVGLTVGVACMYLAWTLGFFLLPEGLLRGRTGAGIFSNLLPAGASVFLLALTWNAAVAFVVMPAVSLLAIGRLSLGYVLAAGHFALYGLFLGTNSFGNPRPDPLLPSLEVFTSTGPWEIGAYMLVAAALARRHRFRQKSWLGGGTTRISRKGERLAASSWVALAAAAVVIVVTAWVEHRRALDARSTSSGGLPAGVVLRQAHASESDPRPIGPGLGPYERHRVRIAHFESQVIPAGPPPRSDAPRIRGLRTTSVSRDPNLGAIGRSVGP